MSRMEYIAPLWSLTELHELIDRALAEDLLGGDVTSRAVIPQGTQAVAVGVAKKPVVVCGLSVLPHVFHRVDPTLEIKTFVHEGDAAQPKDILFRVSGLVHSILAAERVTLNILQHMSGIATLARQYANAVKGTKVRVVDTRKTLPGLRAFQRYAVQVGGCYNHRHHLGSGVLIKENHIRAAGGITQAIKRAHDHAAHTLRVEIEVTSMSELKEAIEAGAELVMVDNMTPEQVKEAVTWVNGRALLEASGGITLETVRGYAEAGVDIISVGALTHSVKAADISLLVDIEPEEGVS